MRLLILIGLIYIGWRVLKSWLRTSEPRFQTRGPAESIDDVMVKDPYCEIYFPQREGIHLRHQGQDLYFCSTACRDRFLESGQETTG